MRVLLAGRAKLQCSGPLTRQKVEKSGVEYVMQIQRLRSRDSVAAGNNSLGLADVTFTVTQATSPD